MTHRERMNAADLDGLQPLSDDEAALVYHVQRYGSEGYPVERRGRTWWIRRWKSWPGFPMPFRTRREAHARFENWLDLARDRWRAMKAADPRLMLTGVGIRQGG